MAVLPPCVAAHRLSLPICPHVQALAELRAVCVMMLKHVHMLFDHSEEVVHPLSFYQKFSTVLNPDWLSPSLFLKKAFTPLEVCTAAFLYHMHAYLSSSFAL